MVELKFDADGLIPAVIQDAATGEVLMVGYMNEEAYRRTVETGKTWFYSRSRKRLWQKGETSGHCQLVKEIRTDCDQDTLLIKVEQMGGACHDGYKSCFYRQLDEAGKNMDVSGEKVFVPEVVYDQPEKILRQVYNTILNRKQYPQEGSYTCYLFSKGQDKILKKVGEEAAETIMASKNHLAKEIIMETTDLWFHTLVMLAYHGITPEEITAEFRRRFKPAKPVEV